MNDRKNPPPPILPPPVKINENFCLLHKGEIEGEIYTCPSCKSKYCMKCAENAREEAKICIKCKHLIIL